MKIAFQSDRAILWHGESDKPDDVLSAIAPGSVDAIVTDPPAGISFMGKKWDSNRGGRDQWIEWLAGVMRTALTLLKPGGHALVWALPRTSHWTATAIEDAGFEIRDSIHDLFDADRLAQEFVEGLNAEQQAAFLRLLESQASPLLYQIFGSGFPKSLNVGKAIDAHLGATRDVVGTKLGRPGCHLHAGEAAGTALGAGVNGHTAEQRLAASQITAPEAARWEGFGTALKPAIEHWILCRKPLEGTVAANVIKHGTGGLNIDACRIESDGSHKVAGTVTKRTTVTGDDREGSALGMYGAGATFTPTNHDGGRFPAHLTLDEHTAAILDKQSGALASVAMKTGGERSKLVTYGEPSGPRFTRDIPADKGGASRFFYVAKGARSEKEVGLDHLVDEGRAVANTHPTVKSLDLMRWLVRLATPPGGLVLDLFTGSGTTGVAALMEGFRFVGIEKEAEYVDIAAGKLAHTVSAPTPVLVGKPPTNGGRVQSSLFDLIKTKDTP